MKLLRCPFSLVLISLLSLAACRESQPLPPGNWTGRCTPSPDAKGEAHYGPTPTSYVHDKAKMFSAEFLAELQKSLTEFQRKSCHQLLVVTVATLDEKTLEDYALQYANRVGLGYRGLNNGVMMLLAPNTRQARLQIGCGLEDVITDKQAGEIMTRDLLPALRDGDEREGIRAGLASLMALASKKTVASQYRPEGCK